MKKKQMMTWLAAFVMIIAAVMGMSQTAKAASEEESNTCTVSIENVQYNGEVPENKWTYDNEHRMNVNAKFDSGEEVSMKIIGASSEVGGE